ncbi:MAG: hypothetical protein Q8S33_12525 [Myxococcales bacterium]|nr:hypothetical protein [Myxococcales bacterium]MDP3501160.1 hypothetical protein [Myxococcales bacterium]
MKVLLARPHDFVVTEMSAALRALGVEPVTLERALTALRQHLMLASSTRLNAVS